MPMTRCVLRLNMRAAVWPASLGLEVEHRHDEAGEEMQREQPSGRATTSAANP